MGKKAKSDRRSEHKDKPRPLTKDEAEAVVGGTGDYSQEQYDKWENQGPADRSGHGPGSGE